MGVSGGIRGSVTRSRSVAQEAVSTTRELSSWGKRALRQIQDVLLSLVMVVFEFRYVPRRNEGSHDLLYFFFLAGSIQGGKELITWYFLAAKVHARDFPSYCLPALEKGKKGMICLSDYHHFFTLNFPHF
jgi:hypothetical protein